MEWSKRRFWGNCGSSFWELYSQVGGWAKVPRPTIPLDSDLRNSVRSYREGGSRYVQRKEWRRWGREGSP